VAKPGNYVPTAKEQAFLDTVENPRYDRQIINGLNPFFEDKAPEDMKSFYTPAEIADAVQFLLRARSMTGQMLALDGGQHLGWAQPQSDGLLEE